MTGEVDVRHAEEDVDGGHVDAGHGDAGHGDAGHVDGGLASRC